MKPRYCIFLILIFISFSNSLSAFEWIAHRGASALAPENTLAAFLLAWQQGVHSVECDVFLSQDKQIVIIHDPSTQRTTNGNLKVNDTPWQLLSRLDAGSWKSPQWRGEKIPLLKSLFELKPKNHKIYVEIKDKPELIDILAKDLRLIEDIQTISIISDDYEVITLAKKQFPLLECLWVVGKETTPIAQNKDGWINTLIAKAKKARLDGLTLDHRLFQGEAISYGKAIKSAGLKWVVWTVDDAQEAHRFITHGVDAITTNDPYRLRHEVQKYNPLHQDLIADI